MIVLDTNVLSEVHKKEPDANVMEWLNAQEPSDLYITAITVEELMFGAFILPAGNRRNSLIDTLAAILEDDFRDRVLPYDHSAADFYAMRVSGARAKGITIGHADGQIGAIVAAQRSTWIATRDTAPFEAMGVKVLNPWEYNARP